MSDPLAELLAEMFPAAERTRWPFTVDDAAEALRAAGVTLTQPQPDRCGLTTGCLLPKHERNKPPCITEGPHGERLSTQPQPCPACGRTQDHSFWPVGDDLYACDAPAAQPQPDPWYSGAPLSAWSASQPQPDAKSLREALRRLVDSAVLVPMAAEDDDDVAECWGVHSEPLEEARAALDAPALTVERLAEAILNHEHANSTIALSCDRGHVDGCAAAILAALGEEKP